MPKKIIVIGGGGHTVSSLDIIYQNKEFKVFGLVGQKKDLGNLVGNIYVKYLDKDLSKIRKKCSYAIITLGQIKNYNLRLKIFNRLKKLKFKIPVIKSKNSYVSKNTEIGDGTMIFNGAVVNSNVKIGSNCIINSKALIEHDVKIGNNCHISTGSILNGNVEIADNCFVGSGSILREGIKIKKNSFIPMGSKIYR